MTVEEVPLCRPDIRSDETRIVEEVLESGWLAHGPKNAAFQEAFADYVGVDHAVTLNSCTSALELALIENGVTGGEVLVPSFTFAASANAIVTAGAEPVFVDVRTETRNIDPVDLEEKVTDEAQAIMPVHYAGQACDMGPIQEIAEAHDLLIVEDSAETLGGTYEGKATGSFGVGCFSFYPTKNLTTAEGGIVTTDDEEMAENIWLRVAHGVRRGQHRPWNRNTQRPGRNLRLSDVQAAIGLAQLERIDDMNKSRRAHAAYYNDRFGGVEGIQTPVEASGRRHVYQMYTILVSPRIRDDLVLTLRDAGVGASVHFDPPVHRHDWYQDQGYGDTELPRTDELARTLVTLPMFPHMTEEEREFVADQVIDVHGKLS